MMALSDQRASLISDEGVSTTVSANADELRCEYPGCGRTATVERSPVLCDGHLADARRRSRESHARSRAANREADACADCGEPSDTYRCAACLIRQDRAPTSGVNNGVNKADRIAARLIPWENSPENEGRLRMRGGKQGRRSVEEENRSDFDLAEKDLAAFVVKICGSVEAARRGEAHVWQPKVQAMPPIQRRAAVMAVLDHAHVAYRLLGEILRRGKHPCAPEADE